MTPDEKLLKVCNTLRGMSGRARAFPIAVGLSTVVARVVVVGVVFSTVPTLRHKTCQLGPIMPSVFGHTQRGSIWTSGQNSAETSRSYHAQGRCAN